MKKLLKRIIRIWPWPLTVNESYDRQTLAVIKKVCRQDSICLDIGCYKGDILSSMLHAAPLARHLAFEPIPEQFDFLKSKYSSRADIHPFALGNENKKTRFQFVKTNPTYSGLRQREYKGEEKIEEIEVELRRLDDIIPHHIPVRLMKIDVEGGELDVMRGAEKIISKWKPYIIFEHGVGGADRYEVTAGDVYEFLVNKHDYRICLMKDFLKNENAKGFSRTGFDRQFWNKINCYFLAVSGS